jgi:hypothetical protein
MQKIEHTSHAGIKFEPNKKLGYYLVGNEIYYNKIQALIDASKKNSHVRWFFNEDVFVKYPWHIEPEESLRELYRQRAQQLRDTYDYVRLELSGGSDSTTVAYSFLLNNIHLDEVIFRYPKAGEKGMSGDPNNTHADNTLSEWEFAAKPLLNWIATNYPKTKITVHDYSEDMIKEASTKDESWIFQTRHYLQPSHANKYRHVINNKNIADKTHKMCVIYGVDKPKMFVKDNKVFLYFIDTLTNHGSQVIGDYTNITNELFYWTPDFPKLIAKQAHEVKRWFSLPHNHQMQGLLQWPTDNRASRTLYEQIVKRIVYPDYDFHTFQTSKPISNMFCEMDQWFYVNFKDTESYSVWQSGIEYFLDNIDTKYLLLLKGNPDEMHKFQSPYYYIGDSNIEQHNKGFNIKSVSLDQHLDFAKKHRHVINGQLVIY